MKESEDSLQYEIKRISLWSYLKISFFVNLVIGFGLGFAWAAYIQMKISLLGDWPLYDFLTEDQYSLSMLYLILPVFLSMFIAGFGTIFGLIILFAYNSLARLIGGITVELASRDSGSRAANSSDSQKLRTIVADGSTQVPSSLIRPLPPPPVISTRGINEQRRMQKPSALPVPPVQDVPPVRKAPPARNVPMAPSDAPSMFDKKPEDVPPSGENFNKDKESE